uniref:ornithine carbamoyltransferase, mitochondrial-like isoform X2 n=1 Tax=Styela clava TaxID=7725 RepID=UPI00193A8922|nr:ornithine carbamoyltransferase, mitochondrial-like isoform X2 [Styela clava]
MKTFRAAIKHVLHLQIMLRYVDSRTMKGRSLLSLADYTREDLLHLLSSAADLKLRMKQLNERFRKLEGKSLGMIFEKTSTRTKISTEIGMNLLGGHSCVIPYEDVQSNANGGSVIN